MYASIAVALLLLPLLLAACLDQPGLPAPAVSIAPGDPGSDDDLQLVLEEIAQGDGRPDLSFDISWSVDGLAVDDLAGAREVGAARTAAGQTWSATVRFELDQQLGPAAEASVTIGGAGDDDDLAVRR